MTEKIIKKSGRLFHILGIIFGALFGYLCIIYYVVLCIYLNIDIPRKFQPLESFFVIDIVFIMVGIFAYLGAQMDDNQKLISLSKIYIISVIVGTIIYAPILLIIMIINGNFEFMYNDGIIWLIGMIIILCCYILLSRNYYK
ncbi:hypothetical protein ACO3VM_06100 [Methanocaldococcus sp. 10A]